MVFVCKTILCMLLFVMLTINRCCVCMRACICMCEICMYIFDIKNYHFLLWHKSEQCNWFIYTNCLVTRVYLLFNVNIIYKNKTNKCSICHGPKNMVLNIARIANQDRSIQLGAKGNQTFSRIGSHK